MSHHSIHRRWLPTLIALAAIAGASPAFASPWIMRHNITAAEYQNFYDNELPDDFRPISVSVNGTGSRTRYTVIAIYDPGVLWAARHDLSWAEFLGAQGELWETYGLRTIAMDSSGTYPEERYVAVWVADGLPALDWQVRHGQTRDQWLSSFSTLSAQGYRVTWLAASGSGSNQVFSTVWRKNTEGWSWKVKIGLDSDEYQEYIEEQVKVGYRVTGLTAYDHPDHPLYGAVFLLPEGDHWEIQPWWEARHRQNSGQFQETAEDFVDTFLQPLCAIQYGRDDDPRFGSVWFEDAGPPTWRISGHPVPSLSIFDNIMEQFMISRKISRGTLAITKDERLVFARAYTNAPESWPRTKISDRFRVASVSKPITAVTILRLIEDGFIGQPGQTFDQRLDTKLIDVPGSAFNSQEWTDPRFDRITIRQVLQHVGGWDRGKSFDPMWLQDFRISDAESAPLPIDTGHIIDYMKDVDCADVDDCLNLDFSPGGRYAYSNFGYCLLGRVIESVTAQPYDDWVRDNVLCRVGAQSMVTGRSRFEDRHPDEVNYRDPMNRWRPSVMGDDELVPFTYGGFNIENMDSHGGWVATAVELARFVSDFTVTTSSELLSNQSISFMWAQTPQSGTAGTPYAAGWAVDGTTNFHGGLLPGTWSYIIRREDGVTISVIFNQTSIYTKSPVQNLDGQIYSDLMSAANGIGSWPGHDLFTGVPGCALASPAEPSGDGDTVDLVNVLSQWGTDFGGLADRDGDGIVGASDLLELLARWDSGLRD